MNNEDINIEEMRNAWMEMGKALGLQPNPGNNPKDLDKKRTALDRLRDRYHAFWIISLIMVIPGFTLFSKWMFLSGNLHLWLGIAFAVYFLTASGMDFWLWRGIGTIDPLRMSVSEIAGKSMFYRKRHLQFMAILIPMAVALLGFIFYVNFHEIYFVNGMIAGVIIGAIIGTIQFRRFMAEYRKLAD